MDNVDDGDDNREKINGSLIAPVSRLRNLEVSCENSDQS